MTYYDGYLAQQTWYDTPGYWTYTDDYVYGANNGLTYSGRFKNSYGQLLGQGSAINSLWMTIYGAGYVSVGCKNAGGGSAPYTSCWAWY